MFHSDTPTQLACKPRHRYARLANRNRFCAVGYIYPTRVGITVRISASADNAEWAVTAVFFPRQGFSRLELIAKDIYSHYTPWRLWNKVQPYCGCECPYRVVG